MNCCKRAAQHKWQHVSVSRDAVRHGSRVVNKVGRSVWRTCYGHTFDVDLPSLKSRKHWWSWENVPDENILILEIIYWNSLFILCKLIRGQSLACSVLPFRTFDGTPGCDRQTYEFSNSIDLETEMFGIIWSDPKPGIFSSSMGAFTLGVLSPGGLPYN